jgi:hypothetical protein
MTRSRSFSVVFIALFSIAVSLSLEKTASAAFLVDPTLTPNTNLASPNLFSSSSVGATGELDNGATKVARPLGFTFPLFGTNISSVFVSINGSLTDVFNASGTDVAWPSSTGGTTRIAPAWDNLKLVGPDKIVESTNANYYAVTWEVSTNGAENKDKMQALLVGGATTIGGFSFLAGDIAFSYNGMNGVPDSSGATIGLRQSNSVYAVPPNAGTGVGSDGRTGAGTTDYGSAIYSSGSTDFILFRPNGTGYDVSIQSTLAAIPEPTTLALLGLGMAGLLVRSRRFPTQK